MSVFERCLSCAIRIGGGSLVGGMTTLRVFSKPRARCVARRRSCINRHCEQSEAIHLSVMPRYGLLRFALMHKRSAFVADNDEDRPRRTGSSAFAEDDSSVWSGSVEQRRQIPAGAATLSILSSGSPAIVAS